jgi:hypothetical protein
MLDRRLYVGPNFATVPCPVCGGMFSKCGLPNHIRRHQKSVANKSRGDGANKRSPAWWDGWKEGYKLGMREARRERKKSNSSAESRSPRHS